MNKVVKALLLLFIAYGANAQVQRPVGNPTVTSTGWYNLAFTRDSAKLFILHDTFPARYPSVVWHFDGNFYKSLGNGAFWTLWVPSTAGTVRYVATNTSTGITGGTITTTGTISSDTAILTTRSRTQQQTDSIIGLIASSGGGTVLSVSVVSANGITGTVANPTSTPAITLGLNNITPTSVNSSGAMTGTTLAGTLVNPLIFSYGFTGTGTYNNSASVTEKVDTNLISTKASVLNIVGDSNKVGANVYYLSKMGVVSDADISFGSTSFGTDQTAAIQAVYNKASNGTPITVMWDVKASVTGLVYYSNTTTIFTSQSNGVILRNNSNKNVFTNAHIALGGQIVDSNVAFIGGTINGNGANSLLNPAQAHDTAGRGWMVGIAAYGVNRFYLENSIIYNTRTFATFHINTAETYISNCTVKQSSLLNTDGFHFDGYTTNVIINGANIYANDDKVVFITNGNLESTSDDYYASATGSITNVFVNNILFNGGLLGLKLQNVTSGTDRIDNVYFGNITGSCITRWLVIENGNRQGYYLSRGNIGTVVCENINVDVTTPYSGSFGDVDLISNIEDITFSNVTRKYFNSSTPRPSISTYSNIYIKSMSINNYKSIDSVGVITPHIEIGDSTTVKNLIINGASVVKNSGLAITNSPLLYVAPSAKISSLSLNSVYSDSTLSILNNTGTISSINASNVVHTNLSSSGNSFSTTTTIPVITLSNYAKTSGQGSVTSGTFTSKLGDGFIADGYTSSYVFKGANAASAIANMGVLDESTGVRLTSYGVDASNYGIISLIGKSSNASISSNLLVTDIQGGITMSGRSGPIVTYSFPTTPADALYNKFISGGGNYYVGISSSTGSGLAPSGTAYQFNILTESARDLVLGTNNLVGMTMGGSTQALTTTNTLAIGSIANATGNFATYSTGGILQQQTPAQVISTLGITNYIAPFSGTSLTSVSPYTNFSVTGTIAAASISIATNSGYAAWLTTNSNTFAPLVVTNDAAHDPARYIALFRNSGSNVAFIDVTGRIAANGLSIGGDATINNNLTVGSVNVSTNISVTGSVIAAAHRTTGGTSSQVVLGDGTLGTYSSGISGLTTNFVTKAASSTTVTNSQIFDDGTSVQINGSIGVTAPKLTVLAASTSGGTAIVAGGAATTGQYVFSGYNATTAAVTTQIAANGNITTTGNIQGASITATGGFSGTLSTGTQPNITSVSNSLTITGSGQSNIVMFSNNNLGSYFGFPRYSSPGNYYYFETGNAGTDDIILRAGGTITQRWSTAGVITVPNLAGSGSRAVLADATGVLSAPVSDFRVKKNLRKFGYGINAIMKLTPKWGEYIDGWTNYGEGRQNFLIAQDVRKVIPEAVFITPSTGKLGINKDQLDAVYVQSLQDLYNMNLEMKKQITELKAEIKALKKKK